MYSRFQVHYQITCTPEEAETRARQIALEQSLNLPIHLIVPGFMREEVAGRVEQLAPLSGRHFLAVISYLFESTANELTQLLNILFGNISMLPGVRITDLELPVEAGSHFSGPRFGIMGLREHLHVPQGPLLMAALKPMGRDTHGLAELAYRFACGGVDVIIDDHMLTDQSWSPFRDRVYACAQAVQRANAETGGQSCYVPNVTASPEETLLRADWAGRYGAGALLLTPGLAGLDCLQRLSQSRRPGLPLIAHPAFLGSYVLSEEHGFTPGFLLGTLFRLAGADCSIFPFAGGRFGFRDQDCRSIVEHCQRPHFAWKTTFPTLGGGIVADNVPQLRECYGEDIVYLVGGGLYGMSSDLPGNVRKLRQLLGRDS